MKQLFSLLASFLLACNLFMTLVLFTEINRFATNPLKNAEQQQIIGAKSAIASKKYLDSFYFNLATILIPIASYVFWRFAGQRFHPAVTAVLDAVWFMLILFFIGKT